MLGQIKQVKINWISFILRVRVHKNNVRCLVILLLKIKRGLSTESLLDFLTFSDPLVAVSFLLSFFLFLRKIKWKIKLSELQEIGSYIQNRSHCLVILIRLMIGKQIQICLPI